MNIPNDYQRPSHRCPMSDTQDRCRGFGHRSPYKHVWCVVILSIPLLCLFLGPGAEAQSKAKNVLFLFSAIKYSDETLRVIEPSLRAHFPHEITFYHAYLDDTEVDENPIGRASQRPSAGGMQG
jgi:hypothetical protein